MTETKQATQYDNISVPLHIKFTTAHYVNTVKVDKFICI